jgi:hypothetical protein
VAAFPGLAQIQLQSTLASGQAVRNTFAISHAAAGTAPDYTELLQLATDIAGYLGTTYEGVLTPGDTFVQVVARQVNDPTSPAVLLEAAFPVGTAGTRTISGNASPDEACAVLSLKTPNASRRFRGHLFVPPCKHAADLNGEHWDAASAYHTAVEAFRTKLDDGCGPTPTWTGTSLHNYTLSIFSKVAATAAQPSVASVQTVTTDYRVHWLRSRGRGTT